MSPKMGDIKNIHFFTCLFRVDPDSTLHKDMLQLKKEEGIDYILLNITFTVSSIIMAN